MDRGGWGGYAEAKLIQDQLCPKMPIFTGSIRFEAVVHFLEPEPSRGGYKYTVVLLEIVHITMFYIKILI